MNLQRFNICKVEEFRTEKITIYIRTTEDKSLKNIDSMYRLNCIPEAVRETDDISVIPSPLLWGAPRSLILGKPNRRSTIECREIRLVSRYIRPVGEEEK